jgi:hypothetical protein
MFFCGSGFRVPSDCRSNCVKTQLPTSVKRSSGSDCRPFLSGNGWPGLLSN